MWKDSIVEKIRKHRDEYSKKFDYDFLSICQNIRKKQGQDNRRIVTPKPRRPKQVTKAV